MVLARKSDRRYSPDEYLALEEGAEARSEYLDGTIYAMTGGFYAALRTGLRGRTCEAFGSHLRLWIAAHWVWQNHLTNSFCARLGWG